MDARLQRRIQRYGWDKAADRYESGWKGSLADAQTALIQIAAARPGERVVDVACGTGLVSIPLAAAVGSGGRVTAIDLSDKMVEAICRNAERLGLRQIEAARADAEDLHMLPDADADLVTCALGLMYVPNPSQALAEALRILRPGGRAVFAVWGERSKCGWAEIFPIVDARVQSAVCPLFFRLGTGSVLAHEMTAAGFVDVETSRLSSVLPYADDDAAIDAAFAGGPVALAYGRFDPAVRAAVHREYLDSIAPHCTPAGYRIPGEFAVCRGYKGVQSDTVA